MTSWNDNPTVKRWVLFTAILVVGVLLFWWLVGSGGDAQAATRTTTSINNTTMDDPSVASTDFTEVGAPYGRTGSCWEFGKWAWEAKDDLGKLRFGYGHDVILCTNPAATRWNAIPTFDIWHWLGYWQFVKQNKSRSQLGYGWVDSTSYWAFKFDAIGIPLATKDRTLNCRYWASNHTANCTLYH